MGRRVASFVVACTSTVAGCATGSGAPAPSIADGGLPVYSVGAPDDIDVDEVAEQLHDVLDLPDEAEVESRGQHEARIDGASHQAVIADRGAGSVIVSYSGPRFSNAGCVDCPSLDESDDAVTAIERSIEILEAVDVDTANVVFSQGPSSDAEIRLDGDVVIDGAVIDDLRFRFVWTQGGELSVLRGGLFDVEVIGTVAPRAESEARSEAEGMIGSERSITDFELVYTGGFRDGELVVAPAYEATTDLGTSISVSAFDGDLPD